MRETTTGYRADIDGLRALSIVTVALFHAGFDDWSGGYIGVDVFFVLSGYLIATQIDDGLRRGAFGFAGFLIRRLRRLAPAALSVIAVTLALGAAVLPPRDASDLATSAVAAATYWSNLLFAAQIDYFDAPAETKPLLHTWSLAIEMQCYLAVAGVAAIAARLAEPERARRVFVVAVAIASVGSVLWAQARFGASDRAEVYFDGAARFWQFGLGALVALSTVRLPPGAPSAIARAIGLALIVGAALRFGPTEAGPGSASAIPALGAALAIAAGEGRGDPVGRVLGAPPLVALGLLSYAFYLWHWPALVAMRLVSEDFGDGEAAAALIAALALAALTYGMIERPVRRRRLLVADAAFARAAAVLLVAVLGVAAVTPRIAAASGAGGAAAPALAALAHEAHDLRAFGAPYDGASPTLDVAQAAVGGCSYGRDNSTARLTACLSAVLASSEAPAWLVIGDSHARDATLALREAFPDHAFAYLHQGGGCGGATYHASRTGGRLCFAALDRLVADLRAARALAGVVVSTRFLEPIGDAPAEALMALDLRGSLGADDLPILVMGPAPSFRRTPERYVTSLAAARAGLVQRGVLPVGELHYPLHAGRDAMAEGARAEGLAFFDRLAPFCDDVECRVFDLGAGVTYFLDAEHLSAAGRARLAAALRADPMVRRFVGAADRPARASAAPTLEVSP